MSSNMLTNKETWNILTQGPTLGQHVGQHVVQHIPHCMAGFTSTLTPIMPTLHVYLQFCGWQQSCHRFGLISRGGIISTLPFMFQIKERTTNRQTRHWCHSNLWKTAFSIKWEKKPWQWHTVWQRPAWWYAISLSVGSFRQHISVLAYTWHLTISHALPLKTLKDH